MIPRLVAISPGEGRDPIEWLGPLVEHGALPGVLLREPGLPGGAMEALVRFVVARVPFVAIHARHPLAVELADRWGAFVHIRAADPPPRGPYGVSTHTAEALHRAFAAGASYALLSPVWAPASKPTDERAPLGVRTFLSLAGARPVLALGGVTPARAEEVVAAGAHGVAVLGGLAGPDRGHALLRYLSALRTPTGPR